LSRQPLETLLLAALDAAVGAVILGLAFSHGRHHEVVVRFFVFAGIVVVFKAREAIPRLRALVAAARGPAPEYARPPLWLRAKQLVLGYDPWSRTERVGVIAISAFVCAAFGWGRGGPFAAALFLALATVNGVLALVALGARLSVRNR
jgi:hypothetical protein